MDHLKGIDYYKYVNTFPKSKSNFEKITYVTDHSKAVYCNSLSGDISTKSEFVVPCQKVVKYLEHMKESSYENDKTEDCRYLNLYINDKVRNIMGDTLTEFFYNEFIGKYKSQYPVLNACNENMKYIERNVLVDVKNILDMYEKLNKVINASDINQNNICSNIDKCYETYMSFETNCKKDDHNNELCDALEKFREYYLFYSSLVMRCTNYITFPSFKKAKEETSFHAGSYSLTDQEPSPGQDDLAGSLQMEESLDQDVSSSNSSNSKTITAISTTLLLFPSLFSLYKVYKEFLSKQKSGFTPLGSLIRPYIQRNQKVQYNANDEMLQLYLPNYKTQDNINKEQLNVPYHS